MENETDKANGGLYYDIYNGSFLTETILYDNVNSIREGLSAEKMADDSP